MSILPWISIHYLDILLHLGLDLTGGLTLRCLMGLCEHPAHRYAVWFLVAILFSISTVALVG